MTDQAMYAELMRRLADVLADVERVRRELAELQQIVRQIMRSVGD